MNAGQRVLITPAGRSQYRLLENVGTVLQVHPTEPVLPFTRQSATVRLDSGACYEFWIDELEAKTDEQPIRRTRP
jgi:hypothetical protein